MAAAWKRAWRSRVASTDRAGGGNSLQQLTCQTSGQPSRHDLVHHSHDHNCGSSTTSSGTTTISSLSTTRSHTSTSTLVGEPAAGRVFHSFSTLPKALVVEERAQELDGENRAKTLGHIKGLVDEFCGASGEVSSDLDRWLKELHVGWVLHLADDGATSGSRGSVFISRQLQHLTRSWILALLEINSYISKCFDGWYGHSQELEETVCPPASEFARFVAATLLKMLPFVDTVVNPTTVDSSCSEHCDVVSSNNGVGAAEKLQALIDVRGVLSGASEKVDFWASWFCSRSSPDTEATRITGEMSSLLLAKLDKLDDTMCKTKNYIRTRIMSLTYYGESSCATQTPQRSPDIHKATQSAMSYINVLSTSYEASLRGKYVPDYEISSPSTSLIKEMFCSLEGKLARASQSFPDHSLGFLFLINNSYLMWQQLHTNRLLAVPVQALARKIDGYINCYLQVSWTPVLKCLHNSRVHCFTRYSPLPKFESKFQKTYSTQKLWKVPDPELRKRLRKAIVDKVISVYT